jgi:hypothetical protein
MLRHDPRFPRAHAVALTRRLPAFAGWNEWEVAAIGLALLLAGLLGL